MENCRVPFNDNWLFCLTDDEAATAPELDDSGFRKLDLPHDWQIECQRSQTADKSQGFFPRDGVGVYRRHFTAPESWRGKTVRVLFDGVQHFCQVYLNGRTVGGRSYGYLPVLCDLTDGLRLGVDNVLAVRVDNRNSGNWLASGGDRWYSGAGIYRNVWLMVQDPARIAHDGIRINAVPVTRGPKGDVPDVDGIRCDLAHVHMDVESEGEYSDCEIHVTVLAPDGACVYSRSVSGDKKVSLDFDLRSPLLWSPDSPALYTARVALVGDGVNDGHTVRFGVRKAEFDSEDGFLLNSRKTKLWGVNLHHDGGVFGAATPIEVWRRRLTALRSLGVNTVRASHAPMAEEVYDLIDELGFFLIDELYDKWGQSLMYFDAISDGQRLADLETMIRRDANHPSIILWSVGNEVRGQYTESFYDTLKLLCDACRRLDPTRAVTDVLIGFVLPEANDTTPLGKRLELARRYADTVDVFCCNYMEQFYEKLRESGMRKPIIGSEVRTLYRGDSRYADHVNMSPEDPWAVVRRHDWVAGAILWAGVDYLGESPFWPLRGWTGSVLDSTGDIKLRGWYCASRWSEKPLLKLAVFDESEPWDGARGMWGFPQMRRHWSYDRFEKVMHVAAFTNCDTVRLYQNSQPYRTGRLADFPDGMIHFRLPFIPGMLRAEGYVGNLKVCEDTLYSDYSPASLEICADKTTLPADGHGVAFVDVYVNDAHGIRYTTEEKTVSWDLQGGGTVLADNGDAWTDFPFGKKCLPTHSGHVMLSVTAPKKPGKTVLSIAVEGFAPHSVEFDFT